MAKRKRVVKKSPVSKKVKSKKGFSWDKWTFNLAWVIAIALAFGTSIGQIWADYGLWTILLVILGIITGVNHKIKEVSPFILVALALAIFTGSSLSILPYVGSFFSDFILYFLSYLVPTALILALRKIYSMFN